MKVDYCCKSTTKSSKLHHVLFCHLYISDPGLRSHGDEYEEAGGANNLTLMVGSALVLVVGIRKGLKEEVLTFPRA